MTEALPVLLFVADARGRNIFTNERAVAYSSISREAMLDDGWLQLLHPDERLHARDAWQRAVATGETYEAEFRFRRHDGEYRLHACRAEPTRDEDGNVLEWFGACVEVEDRRRAEAAARERNDEMQALLDTLPVGVLIAHDPECRHISGNRAGAALLRMPQDANLSKTAIAREQTRHFRVLKHGHEIPDEALPVQRAARGEMVPAEEVDHRFDDGTIVHTVVSARPLFDPAGRPRGAVATILDLTDLKSAEASDRRKAEFLAELGHELRNPLAPLSMALDLCRRGHADPPLVESLLGTMHRQLRFLVSLVDDLLDVARIGRGEIHLQRTRFDLHQVVEAALELAHPIVVERRHELVVQDADGPLPIDGDLKRLTQVVANLLSNAAKYTDPGGAIHIRTAREQGDVVLRVRDTGFGIPPEQLDAIFGMFTRVPEHRGRTGGGGLGIGLALARRVIALHGGSIEARSEGLGHGSEFIVRVPFAEAAVDPPAPAVPDPGPVPAPRRVLVVDDNDDAAEMLRMWLELEGHETRVAHDGPTALDAVERFSPDVVLLDIGLPSMDGYEVARRIRALRGPAVLLVALTGWGQAEDMRRSREAGFDEHLTKPAEDVRLRALLAGRYRGFEPGH